MALFQSTHRIVAAPGGAWWERWSLPYAGGACDQPARTMRLLELVEEFANLELVNAQKRSRAKARDDQERADAADARR